MAKRINPSTLFKDPSSIRKSGAKPARNAIPNSFLINPPCTYTLPAKSAARPATKEILTILDPKTTPNAKADDFSREEVIPTDNSGKDVPIARIKEESIKTPVLLVFAILLKAIIIQSADLIKTKHKTIMARISAGTI